MNVKVSIIVPMFNAEKYIEQCIESLIHQTLSDIEILVIDDGSTDSSVEKLQRYALQDSRIKIICKENSGVSDTRNVGLRYAKGHYVGFVDSDDWIEPNMYELMYNRATSFKLDIVRCALLLNSETGSRIEEINLPYADDKPFLGHDIREKFVKPLIGTNFDEVKKRYDRSLAGYTCVHLYSKNFINSSNIRFDSNLKVYEDLIFNLRCYNLASAVGLVNIPFYHYRQNNSSVCNNYKPLLEVQQDYMVNFISKMIDDCKMEKKYIDALNYRVCLDVFWAISNICDRDNQEGWKIKLGRIKKLVNKNYVQNAYTNLKLSGISFSKFVLCIMVKHRMNLGLYTIYTLKRYLSHLKGNARGIE